MHKVRTRLKIICTTLSFRAQIWLSTLRIQVRKAIYSSAQVWDPSQWRGQLEATSHGVSTGMKGHMLCASSGILHLACWVSMLHDHTVSSK